MFAGTGVKLALFRTLGPTDGTGGLAGRRSLLPARKLALFCRRLLHVEFTITLFPESICRFS
jgi:hypothetical protein